MGKLAHIYPLVDIVEPRFSSNGFKDVWKDVINEDTGEAEKTAFKLHMKRQKDAREFVKVYADAFEWMFDCTKPEQRVLKILLRGIAGWRRHDDSLFLNYRVAHEDYGYEKDEAQFYKALKSLEKRDVIRRDPKRQSTLYVNPRYFFKGCPMEAIQNSDQPH